MNDRPSSPPRDYPDLHDHLRSLDEAGALLTVDIPINKDTEIHPLMRWQFRGGVEEKDRKAMLCTNVIDSKGRKYDIPAVVGAMAASPEVYRIGLGCEADQVTERWASAMANPMPPREVDIAPCQEIVIEGAALNKPGNGLDGLPVPISNA